VLLHEVDHFNKRVAFSEKEITKAKTPKKPYNTFFSEQDPEGGLYFIKRLFGAVVKKLSLEQAEFILNLSNWESYALDDFLAEFMKIVDIKNDAPSIRLFDTSDTKVEETNCYIAMNRMLEPRNTCYKS
jgi:hypothetical protein